MQIDMEQFLLWSMIQRDKDGWRTSQKSSLIFSYQSYQSLQGFTINQKNGELQLDLMEGNNPLFTIFDVDYILKGGIDRMFFSLDPPKDYPECNMHPCNQMRFGPWTLSDGDILQTLFHTDYLLKMFSVGVEIQGQYPYQMRSIYDGLMNRLPDDLKYALRPLYLRGVNKKQQFSRFWFESELIDINEYNDNEVKMIVKQHFVKRNPDGTLSDDKEKQISEETETIESQFANDFTKQYDRIAEYFPEFERLKEISKMLIISRYLKSVRNSILQQGPSIQEAESVLDQLYKQVENQYPQVDKFDEIFKNHLTIDPVNLNTVKNQQKQNLLQQDEQIIRDIKKVLENLFQGLELSNNEINDWIIGQNNKKLQWKVKIVEKILANKESKILRYITKLNEVSFDPVQELNDDYMNNQDKIRWVPAAYLTVQGQQNLFQAYGGVDLCPNVAKLSDQLINDFQNHVKQQNQNTQILNQKDQAQQILESPQQKYDKVYKIVKQVLKEHQSSKQQVETSKENLQKQNWLQQDNANGKPVIETLKGQNQEVKRVSQQSQRKSQGKIQIDKDIDLNFIIEEERPKNKGDLLKGIIPVNKQGEPIGQSGVTVGNGYDIGQHNAAEIDKLDISDNLKQKLKPYCGVKRQQAQELLKQKPLYLTEQELNEINYAIHPNFYVQFERQMKKYPKFYNSLNSQQKTALYDFSYQKGAAGMQRYFQEALEKNDLELAYKLLVEYTEKTQTKSRNERRIKLWKQVDKK